MTFSFKSAALSAAVVTSLFAGSLAHAGSGTVDTTPPPPPPPVVLVVPPSVVTAITVIATNAGLGNLAAVLASAKPGSPEATAAVVSIVTVLSQRASLPTMTRTQSARARIALQRIIARTGRTPALAALLARL